ncbi:unnamed protein product [Bursaphelenchus xylophilus]|uniref:(pine wood nematode) hypothetical protein n=1 Tax=Bursaphelenchus xylophilus TaxID=6326 RepID=A0A7I8XDP1_BURXY|nr:unnamed protein product [Bursaphelenchus xylophilus]CAG9113535.1 unnamed protein product [Bursaphelenchus xylophilus]
MKFIFFCLIFPVATVFSIEKQGYNHSVNVAYDLVLPSRIIENCYGLNERPGVVLDAKDNAQIVAEALRIQKYVDYKVEYVQIGLYADVEKIWWLDARLPFNYSNLPPGFIFPKIPTYFAIEVEGRGRKRGEWFALRHDKRGRAFLCGHF